MYVYLAPMEALEMQKMSLRPSSLGLSRALNYHLLLSQNLALALSQLYHLLYHSQGTLHKLPEPRIFRLVVFMEREINL